jgi:hypothetical protein
MISISIKADTEDLRRKLNNLVNSQLPYATSVALNETAKTLKIYNEALMRKAFENPTPYTMNAFYVQYASKKNLIARLRRKDKAVGKHYLEVQDTGGKRPNKGFENNFKRRLPYEGIIDYITPTDEAPRNKYGNMSQGFLMKVMSQLQVQTDRNMNTGYDKKTKSGRRSRAGRYFVPRPDHPLSQRGGPGVYETKQDPLKKKRQGSRVKKVLNFVQAQPQYKKRTDFDNNMRRAANRLLPKKMRVGFSRAMSTAKLR